jgi:hypothetical protein
MTGFATLADAGRAAPAIAPASGPVLFARYAFGPNRLGYCGPDAVEELFGESASRAVDERALRELARGFDGAWPYLELIATANCIADPLDRRVVDAYWLGNDLLRRVSSQGMADSLTDRFRARAGNSEWPWLYGSVGLGAAPVHAFHVLDVFPRVGLLRGGEVDGVLQVMDSCRIRWGRVLERIGDLLVVEAAPLEMRDGRLTLGQPRAESVEAWRDGAGFVDGVTPGDIVSIHWSWVCDRLAPTQLGRLETWTRRQLEVANAAI